MACFEVYIVSTGTVLFSEASAKAYVAECNEAENNKGLNVIYSFEPSYLPTARRFAL